MISDTPEPADTFEDDEEIERLHAEARRGTKSKYPGKDEMRGLNLRRIAGDEKAREEMIVRNLPLVHWYVQNVCGSTNYDDNIQYGSLGLMAAVDRFDHTKGKGSFGTYALWWIRQSVGHGFHREMHTIRIPTNERPLIQALRDMIEDIRHETGKVPTMQDLIARTGYTTNRIRKMLCAPLTTGSLDARAPGDPDGDSRYESLWNHESRSPSEHVECKEEFAIAIDRIRTISCLLERTHIQPNRNHWPTIIYKRVGLYDHGPEGTTLEVIGVEYGLTRERIRQIGIRALETVALRKLVPNGLDGLNSLVEYARHSLDVVYDDMAKVPSDVLFLLGYNGINRKR